MLIRADSEQREANGSLGHVSGWQMTEIDEATLESACRRKRLAAGLEGGIRESWLTLKGHC